MKLTEESYNQIYSYYEEGGTAIHCEENICRCQLDELANQNFKSYDDAYEYVENVWAYGEDVVAIQSMIELEG